MNARDFLAMIKSEAVDYPPKIILKALRTPKSTVPMDTSTSEATKSIQTSIRARALDEQRRASWFRDLDDNGQELVKELLQECAELSIHSFLAVLDGVGGPYKGHI